MDTANNTYPAFTFPATELSAFAVSVDFFIISLKNGKIIHFTPDNALTFYDWLVAHGVRDIKVEIKNEKPPVAAQSVKGWKGLFMRKNKKS